MLTNGAAIVAGGASGIGAAVVRLLLASGVRTVAADRNGDGLTDLARDLKSDLLITEKVDITSSEAVEQMVERCSNFGPIGYLVNCAGFTNAAAKLADVQATDFDAVLRANLYGTYHTMRSVLPYMQAHGRGAIVNIASTAGLRPYPTVAPYAAAKWAVVGMTASAALEYATHNIRINTICPGVTDTPLYRSLQTDSNKRVTNLTPLQRIATPIEIAEAVVWLLGDKASFVTGVAMPVDGGLTLM